MIQLLKLFSLQRVGDEWRGGAISKIAQRKNYELLLF
jgi:hypothetical protein